MNVRAKFFVKSVTHHHSGSPGSDQSGEVVLAPVYAGKDGNPANADWSKWTPQGEIKMMITVPSSLEAFSPGQNFFVDFSPAE